MKIGRKRRRTTRVRVDLSPILSVSVQQVAQHIRWADGWNGREERGRGGERKGHEEVVRSFLRSGPERRRPNFSDTFHSTQKFARVISRGASGAGEERTEEGRRKREEGR